MLQVAFNSLSNFPLPTSAVKGILRAIYVNTKLIKQYT